MFSSSKAIAQSLLSEDNSTRINLFAKDTNLKCHDKLLNSCDVSPNNKNLPKNNSDCCQNQKNSPAPITSYRLKRIADLKLTCDYNILKEFYIWRREYTKPTVCGMVFCRDSCSKGDRPCPSNEDQLAKIPNTYLK